METCHSGPWKSEPAEDIIQLLLDHNAEADLFQVAAIRFTSRRGSSPRVTPCTLAAALQSLFPEALQSLQLLPVGATSGRAGFAINAPIRTHKAYL